MRLVPRRIPLFAIITSLLALACNSDLSSEQSSEPAGRVQTGTCSEPDGRAYRVTYQLGSTSEDEARIQVVNLEYRSAPDAAYGPFVDDADTFARLESWTPATIEGLFSRLNDGFAFPFVTLAFDQAGYEMWWEDVAGRDAILMTSRSPRSNPRIQFRSRRRTPTETDPEDRLGRTRDRCNVYLGCYAGPAETARVAFLGDSIGVQMASRLVEQFTDRQLFLDVQSGQSLLSMLAAARGIAAGIRDPAARGPSIPDVLVLELGTNDVYGSPPNETLDQFEQRVADTLRRMRSATAPIPCRVFMTVRTAGADQAPWGDARLLARQRKLNQLIRAVVASDPSRLRLIDFEKLSDPHRPGSADPWFEEGFFMQPGEIDTVHPNAAGLTALSDEIAAQIAACLGS